MSNCRKLVLPSGRKERAQGHQWKAEQGSLPRGDWSPKRTGAAGNATGWGPTPTLQRLGEGSGVDLGAERPRSDTRC